MRETKRAFKHLRILPERPAGHMPQPFKYANTSCADKGPQLDATLSHAFAVARNEEQQTAFVIDPSVLHSNTTLCCQLREECYQMRKIKHTRSSKGAQTWNF